MAYSSAVYMETKSTLPVASKLLFWIHQNIRSGHAQLTRHQCWQHQGRLSPHCVSSQCWQDQGRLSPHCVSSQ